MEVILTLSPAMHFAAAITCFITGITMLHYSRWRQTSGVLLGISFLVIAYVHFALYLNGSGLFLQLSNLLPSPGMAALFYLPFSYLYIYVTVTGQKVSAGNWAHLLPSVTWVVLPDDLHTPIRALLMLSYWILELRLVWKLVGLLRELNKPGKDWQRWICIFLTLQLIFVLPSMAVLPVSDNENSVELVYSLGAVGALCLAVAVQMYPQLACAIDIGTLDGNGSAKSKNRLDDELIVQTSQRLEQYLHDHRPFLKQGYTIKELAESMQMPLHLFSAFINQSLGKNFNDLMNHFRILYCQELVQNGEARKLNLHGLAMKCGFSNRNTFTIAFKKSTGLTPSRYLELIYGYQQKLKPGSRKKSRIRKRKSN